MARGGKRTGAGRPKGSSDRAKIAKAVAKSGQTPLAYMLGVMRSSKVPEARRDEMAKAAAPYCHPRLTSISGDQKNPLQVQHGLTPALQALVDRALGREPQRG